MFNESDALGLSPYSAKRNLHHVAFRGDAPRAKEVRVVGDFNDWNPSATPMARHRDGQWMVTIQLVSQTKRAEFNRFSHSQAK